MGVMISGTTEPRRILRLLYDEENKGENRTLWDFELRRELDSLVDLNYAIRSRIVQESLKVEDENRWKHLDLHLLAHFA